MALNTRPTEPNMTDPAETRAAAISDIQKWAGRQYFSKADLAKGCLDFRYYTKTALDALLAAYTNTATLVTTLAGYALLAGRAGGQTLKGGTASGENLTLQSTSHATKGRINLGASYYEESVNLHRVVGSLEVSDAGEFTPSPGGIAAGSREVDYTPTVDNWNNAGCTVLLTGENYTVIGFHDADSRVDFIRVGNGVITLGYDGGFGAARADFAGIVGTAWAALTLNSGGNWANYGGNYASAAYKKVGDLVFLRGLVVRSSGSDTLIATLPSGYRPGSYSLHATAGDDVFARIDVETDGEMRLQAGSATAYLSLDGIVFSIA